MSLAYLDSCVIIDLLDEDPQFGPTARANLAELRQQRLQPVISALVRLECLVQPMAIENSERLHRTLSFLQLFPLLAIQDSTVELATALSHSCQSLITNDQRLSQAAGSLEVRTLACA